jgi:hypothetical protein
MKPLSDSPVAERVVRRWYFNGKGYASKRAAYQAKAKRLMVEMVLGPWVPGCSWDGETCWEELSNANAPEGRDRKEWIDYRFSLFFPHDWVEGCIQKGCQHYGGARGCRINHNGHWQDPHEWDFVFQSCKWSQEQWINAKVCELIAADKEPA